MASAQTDTGSRHGGVLATLKQYALLPTLTYILLHLGCLMAFVIGMDGTALAILAGTYFARVFLLSGVYHRYFAHRSYRMGRTMQFIMGLLAMTTLQRDPIWWAYTHRHHHRHSDTPEDLHSPHHQGAFYSHSLWFLKKAHVDPGFDAVPDLAKFPEMRILSHDVTFYLVTAAYFFGLYVLWGWTGVIWGGCISSVLLFHMTHWVQSGSHMAPGYRRYDTKDRSRNQVLYALLSLGEYHNNHHAHAGIAKQGHAWWEIDPTYWILKLISLTGLIQGLRIRQEPPPPAKRVGYEPGAGMI